MEDTKKILAQNAMLETYNFVNKVYWVCVVCLATLCTLALIMTRTETQHIKLALLNVTSVGSVVLLMIMSISRSTTALKVLTIVASAFFCGMCIGIINLISFL